MNNCIEINAAVSPVVNLAICQNHLPMIPKLTIKNNTAKTVSGLKLHIRTDPSELCEPFCMDVPPIAPSTSWDAVPELILSTDYLSGLTDKVSANVILSVTGVAQPCEAVQTTTALPYHFWPGAYRHPELLAAFVLRNHPAVQRIISQAAVLLQERTGSPSFSGYKPDNSGRVYLCVKAIINAIIDEQIGYALPLPSDEPQGQPIRMPDEILTYKLATCLDLSTFICAALECVGYDTGIYVLPTHAIPCVHLEKSTISEPAIRDKDRLLQDKNILPIESTALCAGKNASFEDAIRCARDTLAKNKLEYYLDISAARRAGISPLPIPNQPKRAPEPAPQAAEPPSKLERYEKKLLNLSLKNALLNMKYSGSGLIPLLTQDLSDYRVLSKKATYGLYSVPWSGEGFEALGCDKATASLEKHQLPTPLDPPELENRCKAIYKKYQTCLHEQGVHILCLGVGILRYYDTAASTEARYAPLELYPLEMIRQNTGFRFRLLSDEPQLNLTLVEKLKQSHGLTLAQPDSAANALRTLAATQPRWAILEQACIGQFSYAGCVMWNDIHSNRPVLEQHPLIHSLLGDKLPLPAEEEDDVLWFPLVTDLDPSQERSCRSAVHSKTGHVIFGPAGCGKTTVTANIITGLGYLGCAPLFTVEQATAKNVVKELLDKLGFGDLALDLYDPKVRTADVLRFLEHILELPREEGIEGPCELDSKLGLARQELDAYAQAMHRKHPCGQSLHQLIQNFDYDCSEITYRCDQLPPAAEMTRERLDAWTQLFEKLSALVRALGCAPCDHPLRKLPDRCPERKEQLLRQAEAYRADLEELSGACADFTRHFHLVEPETQEDYRLLAALGQLLRVWLRFPAGLTRLPDPASVRQLCDEMRQVQELNRRLLRNWTSEFLRLDAQKLLEEYGRISHYPDLAKKTALYALNKKLLPYQRAGISPELLGRELELLRSFQQLAQKTEAALAQLEPILAESFPKPYRWDEIRSQAEDMQRVRSRIEAICGPGFLGDFDMTEASDLIHSFCAAWDKVDGAEEISGYLPEGGDTGTNWIDSRRGACDAFAAGLDGLRDWTAFQDLCAQAEEIGLGAAVEDLRSGKDPRQVCQGLHSSLHQCLINHMIDSEPALRRFSGPAFRQQAEAFRTLQDAYLELSRKRIRSRVIRRIQRTIDQAAGETDTVTFLRRAIRSKGKNLPLRTLVTRLGDLLPRLCLCILASPTAVAQLLPMKQLFSHVIVDEASQVPTARLLGSIARSRTTVLIGDPNQLPPTSFFQPIADTPEDLVQDLESVLDDGLALGLPQTHLLWHYRSHSSIVAFPHYKFYGKDLLRLPACDRSSHVHLIQVPDGLYDRGGTRQNRPEAQALVDHLTRMSHDRAYQDKSVGIIAMNLPQKNLIETLLESACHDDPRVDRWLRSRAEPLFCQNLESAQGSERDIILLSVNFGPDAEGVITNTWGPLSQETGWRRLNVAITRAREEMFVFSSLQPEQITLTSSSTLGVQALKEYLQYAAGTPLPQQDPDCASDGTNAAQWLCRRLAQDGYQCVCNVGSGSLRIDVAVVDPENEDRYLLGILMDGPMYAEPGFYNRESAIPQLLAKSGWTVFRLCGPDFWDHRNTEADKILKLLDSMKRKQAG